MVERSEGKLHPLIEFLIIAGIILVCSLCSSFFMSKIITQKSYAETEGIINIFSWLNMIFPFVASFVCIKLIEHRNINIFKLFTIVLCIMLFCNYIHLITLNYIGARFGVVYLAKLTSANSFVKPFVTAFLITLFIYIFDLPKADAYVFDKKMLCGLFGIYGYLAVSALRMTSPALWIINLVLSVLAVVAGVLMIVFGCKYKEEIESLRQA